MRLSVGIGKHFPGDRHFHVQLAVACFVQPIPASLSASLGISTRCLSLISACVAIVLAVALSEALAELFESNSVLVFVQPCSKSVMLREQIRPIADRRFCISGLVSLTLLCVQLCTFACDLNTMTTLRLVERSIPMLSTPQNLFMCHTIQFC